MTSSPSSSSDNKAMAFLKKIGRVGGDADIDYADAAGTDEGSSGPRAPADPVVATTPSTTAALIKTLMSPPFPGNPANMLCPQLSLDSPTARGHELAVVACG